MTGNATQIRQTARPRQASQPASGRGTLLLHPGSSSRDVESPSRQLVCHSRAHRRPYRQLALLPDGSSALPRDRPAYRQERSEAAGDG
jgi:hypothetical protein